MLVFANISGKEIVFPYVSFIRNFASNFNSNYKQIMRILITGAVGFIGSHLAEQLALSGHEVIGLDNFSEYYSPWLKELNLADIQSAGVKVFRGDLRSEDDLRKLPGKFDAVFHLAAQPGISPDVSFADYLENNVIGTQHLLNYVKQNSANALLVNISTSSAYGAVATRREDEAPEPVSWYGVTKLAAEQLVLAEARLNRINGCSLRLYSVYGPRERPDKLFTSLISCGLRQVEFSLYEGSETHLRSFTYVGDIVEGISRTLVNQDKVVKRVINLGSEEERTTSEGIATVEELLDVKIPVRVLPPRSGDQLRTCADIRLAKELLGYAPETVLRDGLKHHIKWYKEKFIS